MNQFEENTAQEKIFNLQLTVQKLEEELQLYRNGTSVTELMELIHEKDVEIETLTLQNEEKATKLKKLAKTSGEVLIKYENLQVELQNKQDLIYDLEKGLREVEAILQEKEEYIEREIKINQVRNQQLLEKKDTEIGDLELKLWEAREEHQQKMEEFEQSTKLLESKVAEQNTIIQDLKEAVEQADKAKNDLTHSMSLQVTELPLLREQIVSLETLVEQQKKIIKDSDENILSLQKRCSVLVNDHREKQKLLDLERQEMIKNIQEFRDSMNKQLAKRDENLQRKDDKIRELNFRLSVLQKSTNKMSVSSPATTAASSCPDKENVINL